MGNKSYDDIKRLESLLKNFQEFYDYCMDKTEIVLSTEENEVLSSITFTGYEVLRDLYDLMDLRRQKDASL